MTRFLYQHRQSHRTNQMEKEYPENLDTSFRNDIDLQNTVSECKREYFIWKSAGSPHTFFVLFFFSPLLFLLSSHFGHSLPLIGFPFIFGTYLQSPQHLSPRTNPEYQAAMATAFLFDKLTVVKKITQETDLTTLDKEETRVHTNIFSSEFPVSRIRPSHLQPSRLAGLPWTWALWLRHVPIILNTPPHFKSLLTGELRVPKRRCQGLAYDSSTSEGTREVCFVLMLLTLGSPLPQVLIIPYGLDALSIFKYRIPDSSGLWLCSFLTTLSWGWPFRTHNSINLGEAWKIVAWY